MERGTAEAALEELTAEQRAVVQWGDGPLMVLAGAGTGKTTVIIERVCHLLAARDGLEPESVLVLTYNTRAAAELLERLERRLGVERAGRIPVHTFHSFGHRILTDNRSQLGLREGASVLDGVGQRLLLREIRHRFDGFLYHRMSKDASWTFGRLADVITRAKDELVTPEAFTAYARAREEAFAMTHGVDALSDVVEGLRRREAEGRLWQVREVRTALVRGGADAATKKASREARRDIAGAPVWWTELTREQERLAKGLMPNYVRDAEAYDLLRVAEEAEAYAVYQRELHDRGLVDFGEQQLRAVRLLIERPNLLRDYQSQFQHVLVDEFQDTNMAQILLLELIGRGPDKPDNVMVVGDDDQSIYRFRGASYAAFRRFGERFGKAPAWAADREAVAVPSLPLLQNRRSSGRILSVASRLISRNQGRLKEAPLQATKPHGRRVEVIVASDEADEADAIVSRIREMFESLPERVALPGGTDRPRRWSDVAVLYRKHRHRDLIVERLKKQEIPHIVLGGSGLFSVPEVRDLEAALRVAADPEDSVSFVRLLSARPWALDATEILMLTRAADWDGRPVYQAALDVLREGSIPIAVTEGPAGESAATTDPQLDPLTLWAEAQLPSEASATVPDAIRERRSREQRAAWRHQRLAARLRAKLERITGALNELVVRARRDGPFSVLEDHLARTNMLHDLIAVGTPDAQRTVLALARLMRFTADWQRENPQRSLADFVAYLEMYQQVGGDLDVDVPDRADLNGVQLMTVYQAKGLEYEIVVVPRLVENQWPDPREESQLIPLELLKQAPPAEFAVAEERRLAFVAMTRARSHLLLTTIESADGKVRPSRFATGDIADVANVWDDLTVTLRQAPPAAEIEASEAGAMTNAQGTATLLKLLPLPDAQRRRFALRRRAVEIIGSLEALAAVDHEARSALTAELVEIAQEAASAAEPSESSGSHALTLSTVSRDSLSGASLLEMASLPQTFSHSQFATYLECPLRYAFERVYRIPTTSRKSYFEFGAAVHAAFESYARARRDARAAGAPQPGYEALRAAFDGVWEPTAYPDAQSAEQYASRIEPALRRFYDREVASLGSAIDFEVGFTFSLDPGGGSPVVRFYGVIDRIDRHPDGSIEVTDYKTGKPRTQPQVDADGQLSLYALALARGAVRDPVTGATLPPACKLTLYFTETDQALSTTRSAEDLDAFATQLVATATRIRSGDFTASPDYWRCGRCDYRALCPSRHGDPEAN